MDVHIWFESDSLQVISFLNDLELICLHACIAIVSRQLNGFNYCYITLIILFNSNYLFANNEVVTGILNLTLILFDTIHLFTHSQSIAM